MIFQRTAAATALLGLFFFASSATKASDVHRSRIRRASLPAESTATAPEEYRLRMHHLHTGEDIDVVYRVGDEYVPSALARLNYFLRDHRTGDESSYDPRGVRHAARADGAAGPAKRSD